jgi:hypothetical protein
MMKAGITLAGLALVILPIFTMLHNFRELEVKQEGSLVEVIIRKLPNDCIGSRRSKLFVHFEYQQKIYSMQIGTPFCQEHRVGQSLCMKHLNKYEDIFVFPEENIFIEMISGIFLSCVGLFVVFKYGIFNLGYRKARLR